MNTIKRLFAILVLFTLVTSYATPIPAYAQAWGNCVNTLTVNGKQVQVASLKCLPVVFNNIVNAALIFVGSVSVILLIYAGIRFVTSGGDPKQVQAARQIITYAIIGLVLVLASFGIIIFIGYITNSSNCITNINGLATGGCK